MRFLTRTIVAGICVAALAAPAGAATSSQSYSGSWPVTVTKSQHSNGMYCLTLKDGGSGGWRHSGQASMVTGGGSKFPYGTFAVINRELVATIEAQGYGQNASLIFIASASHGNMGKGVFEDAYGGEAFDIGELTFGIKNGC